MKKPLIYVHTLVKNEENFVWYALNSVVAWVDKILVWDTGSTDSTVEIIKETQKQNPDKISFREAGSVTPEGHSRLRQKMLEESAEADWVLVLDGDEVWWEDSIKKLVETINKKPFLESIVVKSRNLVGDIFHYQSESAGKYEFFGKRGHFNLRAFSTHIPGLHIEGVYPLEGYFDETNTPIQENSQVKGTFLDVPYLHFTHLKRSTKDDTVSGRLKKYKLELGEEFPLDFYYPEVFFRPRPDLVSFPARRMDNKEYFLASLVTPFRKIKRKIFK